MDEDSKHKQEFIQALTDMTNRIGMLMVDAVNGETGGGKIPWDAAVFAAALAIRGVATGAQDRLNLSQEAVSAAVERALARAFEGEIDMNTVERTDLAARLYPKAH